MIALLLRVVFIAGIAVAHVWTLFALYPSQSSSPAIRFVVPTVIAFILYLALLLRKHLIISAALAAVLTALSTAAGLILAINTYGS